MLKDRDLCEGHGEEKEEDGGRSKQRASEDWKAGQPEKQASEDWRKEQAKGE